MSGVGLIMLKLTLSSIFFISLITLILVTIGEFALRYWLGPTLLVPLRW